MLIRIATETDAPSLAELRWQFQMDLSDSITKTAFLDSCIRFFRQSMQQNWTHWVAEVGGELVAMISIQGIQTIPAPRRINNSFGYLTNFYTKPDFRGQGIGQQLLQTAQAWAVEQSLELLIVWSSEEAIGHYKKQGFRSNEELLEFLIQKA